MSGTGSEPDDARSIQEGDVIHDPVHGETMRFLQIGGGDDPVLRVEMTVEPQASGPPAHVHPNSTESFHIRAGAIRVKAGGEHRVVTAGETMTVEPSSPHTFYNHTGETAIVLVEWQPGRDMAAFLDKWFELARRGRLNSKGMATPLQTAVLFDAYLESIALPLVPLGVQRTLFRGLGRLGRRRGYSAKARPSCYGMAQVKPPGVRAHRTE